MIQESTLIISPCLWKRSSSTTIAADVRAYEVQFNDSSIYWEGWSASTHNTRDSVGTPDFLGGSAQISLDGYLTGLTFRLRPRSNLHLWDILTPVDLFINTNSSDSNWDFLVDLVDENLALKDGNDPYYNLYEIDQAIAGNDYTMSSMPGYDWRKNHPVGFEVGSQLPSGSVLFSGWPELPSGAGANTVLEASFIFGEDAVPLSGDSFTIGWTVNCANDVVYEEVAVPTPEPASLLLLGFGIIGLSVFVKKIKKSHLS